MFDLIASLNVGNAEVTIKGRSDNPKMFNNLMQEVLKLNSTESKKTSLFSIYQAYVENIETHLSISRINSIKSAEKYLKVLLKDVFLETLDKKTAFEIKTNIAKLPSVVKNKDFYEKGLSLNDTKPEMVLISTTAGNSLLTIIKAMMNWACSVGKADVNYFDNLKKTPQKKKEKVSAYTIKELKILFDQEHFEGFCKKYDERYWVCIISLYTGMRIGEIVQLTTHDVIENKNGLMLFNIDDSSKVKRITKHLKNNNSIRIIPIPNKILELGFKDYLNTIKKEGFELLFPRMERDKSGNITPNLIASAFKEYKDPLIKERPGVKTDFHSFRHSFIAYLQSEDVNLNVIQNLVGHSSGTITLDIYGEARAPEKLIKAINLPDYGLDIKPWVDTPERRKSRLAMRK